MHTAAFASTLNLPSAMLSSAEEGCLNIGGSQQNEESQVPSMVGKVASIAEAVQKLQSLLQRAQDIRLLRQSLALTPGDGGKSGGESRVVERASGRQVVG